MPAIKWKTILLKIPGASRIKDHLLQQGHTDYEAETGGAVVAGMIVFVLVVVFNSFLVGFIKTFFNSFWDYCWENPDQGVIISLLGTIIFLAIFFRFLGKKAEKKAAAEIKDRTERHKIHEKHQHIHKGAMGNFEEVFRFKLAEKNPRIEIKTIHMVDNIPRIRFKVQRFNTELGGEVDKNYQLFRDTLFADTLVVLETAFGISEVIPVVIVDAMMNFISRSAKYYDGAVLSLKAERDVYNRLDRSKMQPFKILNSFEVRYNDGMEAQPFPEEESKTARIVERIMENAPRINVRYEDKKIKVDDGWEKPKFADEEIKQETLKGRELNSLTQLKFQELILHFLSKMSFDVRGVKNAPGGAIQIQADFQHPVVGGNFIILARQYPETAPVHADLVRSLDEQAREESCKRGIFIITGRFTEEAKNITRKLAVDLVDGAKLTEVLEGQGYDGRWTFRVVDEKGVVTDLSKMPLMSFEREVDLFLKSMGFKVEKIRRVPGGSVVAVAEFPHPVTGGKFAVMARQFPAGERVSAEMVSELSHTMNSEFCRRGILMVTADFARDAQALARFSGVELVDRNIWENLRRHI